MTYKSRHLFLHLIPGIVRLLLLCKIEFSAFAIWIYHSLGNVASKINKCFFLFFSVASWVWPNTFINSDVTKCGRATKPSTSCPEPGRNWMKDEDAYSASLYYIVRNYGQDSCYLEILHVYIEHFHSPLTCSYGGKSYTTYWFLVLLCYWGYWTVAELFILDIYILRRSIHWSNNNVIVIHGFSSILSFLLSVHRANSALFLQFTALIVPFFLIVPGLHH